MPKRAPDAVAFDVARAQALCRAAGVPWPIEYHRAIGSTQDRARELAQSGAPETVVLAEEQTRGRGQRGRRWYSPPGSGNWLSLALRPALPAERYPLLTLAAGVAIAEAVDDLTGLRAGIKWPNDIWLHGKKCAGILAESDAGQGWAMLGIGVNVSTRFPPELADHAISLHEAAGAELGRVKVLVAELSALRRWLDRLVAEPDAVVAAVAARDVLRDQRVRLETVSGRTEGIARGIDQRGALLVDTHGRLTPFLAGIAYLEAHADGRDR